MDQCEDRGCTLADSGRLARELTKIADKPLTELPETPSAHMVTSQAPCRSLSS